MDTIRNFVDFNGLALQWTIWAKRTSRNITSALDTGRHERVLHQLTQKGENLWLLSTSGFN